MPTNRKRTSRNRVGVAVVLDGPQTWELLIGPGGKPSRFRNESEQETAWRAHRDDLLGQCPPGVRPWAWWRYDCLKPWGSWVWERSGKPCMPVHQAVELHAMGVVEADERALIERQWAKDDYIAHQEARAAVAVNGVDFAKALRANRELRGVPDLPLLEKPVPMP